MRLKLLSLVVLGLGAMGCGGGGPGSDAISEMDRAALSSEEEVRSFGSFNPILFYFMNQAIVHGISLEEGEGSAFEDDCPTVTRDESGTRIVGGCTTEGGVRYEGEVEFVTGEAGMPHGKLTFKEFSVTDTSACDESREVTTTASYDGTVELTGDAEASALRMNVAMTVPDIDDETCTATSQTVGYVYEGTIDGPVPNLADDELPEDFAPSTWNGKGKLGVSGHGYVEIETEDEVMDFKTCIGAQSGKARLIGEKKVEFTFHGAEQCGTPATWTLDGVEQGEIEGVTCSAMGGGTLSAFGLLALGGLLLRRRRSVG